MKKDEALTAREKGSRPLPQSQFLCSTGELIKYKMKTFYLFPQTCHKCQIWCPFLLEFQDTLWEKQFSCLFFFQYWDLCVVQNMGQGVRKWTWVQCVPLTCSAWARCFVLLASRSLFIKWEWKITLIQRVIMRFKIDNIKLLVKWLANLLNA